MSGGGHIAPARVGSSPPPQPTATTAAATATATAAAPDTPASIAPVERAPVERAVADYLASDDPTPDRAVHEIGDGDFRAIGAEFLRHFVGIGGLTPQDDVLDIGCGFGRMALPLTRFLGPRARYLGFDIVREPVDWCRVQVAPRHGGFRFGHVDVRHPLYNPAGALAPDAGFVGCLPALHGWQPGFIAAVSVFTHLEIRPLARLLADARVVLRPGGRLFMTAFLTGDGTPAATERSAFPDRAWRRDGPLAGLVGEPMTAAVGIDWPWFEWLLSGLGWTAEPPVYGHWRRGGADPAAQGREPFQDVVVAR